MVLLGYSVTILSQNYCSVPHNLLRVKQDRRQSFVKGGLNADVRTQSVRNFKNIFIIHDSFDEYDY